MRPLDLLALRIDEDQKNFIKEFHGDEKNFKIAKQFEVYTWGRSSNFNLGYIQINDLKYRPKMVNFGDDVSIKDVVLADTFSLALSEEGQVFSWGQGHNGHLGHSSSEAVVEPKLVKFDFKDEDKKIKRLREKNQGVEGMEELIQFHQFMSKSNKKDPTLNQKTKQVESEILLQAFNLSNESFDDFTTTKKQGKKSKKLLKQTIETASQIINKPAQNESNFLDI